MYSIELLYVSVFFEPNGKKITSRLINKDGFNTANLKIYNAVSINPNYDFKPHWLVPKL